MRLGVQRLSSLMVLVLGVSGKRYLMRQVRGSARWRDAVVMLTDSSSPPI